MQETASNSGETLKPSPRTTVIDKRELVRRIEAGETGSAVARRLGVSRQYVSFVWKDYQRRGEAALHSTWKRRRPPDPPLTDAQAAQLHDVIRTHTPASSDLSVELYGNVWAIETVRELAAKRFGFLPSRGNVAKRLESWGMPTRQPNPLELAMYTPEFKAYLESPLCKEIEARERALMEKTQREAEERLRVHDQFLRETDWAGPGAVDSATSSFLQSGAGAAPKRVAAHSIRTGKHAKGGRQSKSRNKRKRGSARKK